MRIRIRFWSDPVFYEGLGPDWSEHPDSNHRIRIQSSFKRGGPTSPPPQKKNPDTENIAQI